MIEDATPKNRKVFTAAQKYSLETLKFVSVNTAKLHIRNASEDAVHDLRLELRVAARAAVEIAARVRAHSLLYKNNTQHSWHCRT